MRRLDYIGRIRGVPATRIIELTEHGYELVGSESDVKMREAQELLLEHLPDSEADAVTLPTLWARGSDEKGRPAGPLAGSEIGKTTFRDAAEALLRAGRLVRREVNAQKHLWWCVSVAPDATGHIDKEGAGGTVTGEVSGGPSLIRPDTGRPDTGTWAPDPAEIDNLVSLAEHLPDLDDQGYAQAVYSEADAER